MPKYQLTFYAEVTQRLELEVEAETPEAAAQLARELEAGEEVQGQTIDDQGWETLWDCCTEARAGSVYQPSADPYIVDCVGTVDELHPAGAPALPRVLVEVRGGCAELSTDGREFNTLIVDYDNGDKLPDDWKNLATI